MSDNFRLTAKVQKVDKSLGLVLGWAIVCKEQGQDYFDLQGDHIPEDVMLEAVTDFMKSSNVVKDMHLEGEEGNLPGSVLFSFPMTEEIQKAFGITCERTGWIVGVMPEDKGVIAKFASGEYTGFSIGGSGVYEA